MPESSNPEPVVAPYGSWKSPITADLITSETIGFGGTHLDGDSFYWIEMRPSEGGRYVLVGLGADGSPRDVTPQGFNVRTTVHEYGGASAYIIDGTVYFSNFADQRLYRQSATFNDPDAAPRPITPEAALRFTDLNLDRSRDRLIAVCEDHSGEGEARNYLVAVDLNGATTPRMLTDGRDFYAAPRLSPDGSQLAWLEWNHPNMPWDGTELHVAAINDDGSLAASRRIAGGPDESIFQPTWSPDGRLYFVSDRNGWWNLYRATTGEDVEPVVEVEAEMGLPHWGFGTSTYGFVSASEAIGSLIRNGEATLTRINLETGALTDIDTPYTTIDGVVVSGPTASFLGGAPDRPLAAVRFDTRTNHCQGIRRSSDVDIDPAYISTPEAIEFPTEAGPDGESRTAHAFYYPPNNANYRAPDGERAPLLVMSHGGPTGATHAVLNLRKLFWTSRGIGVLDVNYGGSTGYGRDYRRRLNGTWGIVDVDDCCNGAKFLVDRGEADAERLAITGGSAGGWTTLCALTFRDTFAAGASHFGVSDAEALATDTHKFESRYMDSMIGPNPERKDLYDQRSPIHHTDGLNCPVAFFQGLEDKIVLPDQSERMANALRGKGLPVAYLAFEGEQHGFRRAENIKRALEGELYFYSRIFGFDLADPVEPIRIDNLPAATST